MEKQAVSEVCDSQGLSHEYLSQESITSVPRSSFDRETEATYATQNKDNAERSGQAQNFVTHGESLLDSGYLASALSCYLAARTLSGNSSAYAFEIGNIHERLGNLNEASKEYLTEIQKNLNSARSFNNLQRAAKANSSQKYVREKIRRIKHEFDKPFPEADLFIAQSYLNEGKINKAQQRLERVKSEQASNPTKSELQADILFTQACILESFGSRSTDIEAAFANAEELAKNSGKTVRVAQYRTARAEYLLKRANASMITFHEPEDPIESQKSPYLSKTEQKELIEQAIALARSAIRVNPASNEAHDLFCRAHLAKNYSWDEIADIYKNELLTDLFDESGSVFYGRALNNACRYSESSAVLKKYLGGNPFNETALLELGKSFEARGDSISAARCYFCTLSSSRYSEYASKRLKDISGIELALKSATPYFTPPSELIEILPKKTLKRLSDDEFLKQQIEHYLSHLEQPKTEETRITQELEIFEAIDKILLNVDDQWTTLSKNERRSISLTSAASELATRLQWVEVLTGIFIKSFPTGFLGFSNNKKHKQARRALAAELRPVSVENILDTNQSRASFPYVMSELECLGNDLRKTLPRHSEKIHSEVSSMRASQIKLVNFADDLGCFGATSLNNATLATSAIEALKVITTAAEHIQNKIIGTLLNTTSHLNSKKANRYRSAVESFVTQQPTLESTKSTSMEILNENLDEATE